MVRVTLRLAPFPRALVAAPVANPPRTTAVRAASPRSLPSAAPLSERGAFRPPPVAAVDPALPSCSFFLFVSLPIGTGCRRLLPPRPGVLAPSFNPPPPCSACGPRWCAAAYSLAKAPTNSAGCSGGAIARVFLSAAALLACLRPFCHVFSPPTPPGRGLRLGERAMATPGGAKGGVPRSFVSPESRELLPRAK